MLAGGNLVRQFLVASHRQDTLLDLTGRGQPVSCHFNPPDETRSVIISAAPRQTQRLKLHKVLKRQDPGE
jgi:hypothetical protein